MELGRRGGQGRSVGNRRTVHRGARSGTAHGERTELGVYVTACGSRRLMLDACGGHFYSLGRAENYP